MFVKRMLAAVLVAVTFANTLAKNHKYSGMKTEQNTFTKGRQSNVNL